MIDYLVIFFRYMYNFIQDLNKGIRSPFQMFSWRPGGSRAGEAVHVVWRIPNCRAERDDNKAFQLQTESLKEISLYQTRVKKALFLSTVIHPSFIDSKAAACAMYNYLTRDHLPRERCKGKGSNAMDMTRLALASQDFDIIQILRELNGRPRNTLFDVFWGEIKPPLNLMLGLTTADMVSRYRNFVSLQMNPLLILM